MKRVALTAAWACCAVLPVMPAMTVTAQQTNPPPGGAHVSHVSHYEPMKLTAHARTFYHSMRGIDNMSVRRTASGNLLRFSYRVTDPALAKFLGDKSVTPYLYDEASHVLLEVPVMDNIGQLRQTGDLEVNQEYWMVFSNKGNLVKAGDRVNVLIGSFHIDGLVVQ
jgi:hypothetical protein